jgi:3-phosphoshikimate 1-carboxyvinyltransferase
MKNSTVTIFPSSFNGKINTVSSKSMAHRVLIASALASKPTKITNVDLSEDINATIHAIRSMNVDVELQQKTIIVTPPKKLSLKSTNIDCNESGSTLRFMIPVLSLLKKEVTFTGAKSLLERPMDLYEHVFKLSDASFNQHKDKIVIKGFLKPRKYILDGSISSQFFTGLMFTLPLLEGDSIIEIKGPLESKSYIDLTIQVLDHFGIKIIEQHGIYYIKGNQTYKAKNINVEGDYSQAAFMLVGGIISGHVGLTNLLHNSIQGDRVIISEIEQMSGKIIRTENGYLVNKSQTKGTTIDLSNCPDLGPILSLLGALSEGTTTLINAGRLKLKESNRIESTVKTLHALGANIQAKDDKITIIGKHQLQGGVTVDSYNDHRIAMMVSIAALRCQEPVVLTRATSVNKSYPHFFDDYKELGGIIKV